MPSAASLDERLMDAGTINLILNFAMLLLSGTALGVAAEAKVPRNA